MSTTRKSYTEEFKREAVALVEKSGNRFKVARDLGIHASLLKKWQQKLTEHPDRPFPGKGNPQDEELHRLKKENARLKEEVEILKRSVSSASALGKIPVH
jgi:transposase